MNKQEAINILIAFACCTVAGLAKANAAYRTQVKDLSDHLEENREIFIKEKMSLLNDNIVLLEKMKEIKGSSEYVLFGVNNLKFKVTANPFYEVSYSFLLNGTRYGDSIVFPPPKDNLTSDELMGAVNQLAAHFLWQIQNLTMEASDHD